MAETETSTSGITFSNRVRSCMQRPCALYCLSASTWMQVRNINVLRRMREDREYCWMKNTATGPYYGNLYALMVRCVICQDKASKRSGWRSIEIEDSIFIYRSSSAQATCDLRKALSTIEKMPFGINNPFPTSVASECKKAGKVSSRQPCL